jgi:light-regulated signal transduction histidine kinase (bacteriophytochrome)
MIPDTERRSANPDAFRAAVDDVADQLSRAVDGDFDILVRSNLPDETLDKLVMLVNFALDAARRAIAQAEDQCSHLEARNADLEQFAYVASHDLQEPLRMVTSFLQLLERRYAGQLDERADEYIRYSVDGAKRMQTLIQDLLAFSRVGTHGGDLVPTDLEEVFEEARRVLGPTAVEAGAEITSGPLPTVQGDHGQLLQLLQNLIGNAIKFRGVDPPTVHVEAGREDGFWRFEVRDNGIGIPDEQRQRVFQIFQRLHTREEYEGTGIGLAICKRIVERHGGEIGVDSTPGEGTTFWFTLPDPEAPPPAPPPRFGPIRTVPGR